MTVAAARCVVVIDDDLALRNRDGTSLPAALGRHWARSRPGAHTYLVALARSVRELRAEGWTVVDIGVRRKVDDLSLSTLNRRLGETTRRGLV
jgi:hypothetical protein